MLEALTEGEKHYYQFVLRIWLFIKYQPEINQFHYILLFGLWTGCYKIRNNLITLGIFTDSTGNRCLSSLQNAVFNIGADF